MVAGNSEAVTLSGLKADTQYQVTVAAVWAGKKYRSRPIVFRTLGMYILCLYSLTSHSLYAPQRHSYSNVYAVEFNVLENAASNY